MSGGYRDGQPPTDLAGLIEELDEIERRLRILEAPTAEQSNQTVANASKPAVIYQLDLSPSITPTAANVAQVNVPVPDGYTRALVSVTASVTLLSNAAAGTSALLMVAAIISPAPGASFYNNWTSIDGQKYGNAVAASSALVEGLTPGSTIDVHGLVSFPAAYTLPRACVSGSVLFLR